MIRTSWEPRIPARQGEANCFDDFHVFILMTNDFGTDYGKAMDRMTNYAGMVLRLSYLGAMIVLVLV